MAIELIVLVNSLFPFCFGRRYRCVFPLAQVTSNSQSFSFSCYAGRVVNNMIFFGVGFSIFSSDAAGIMRLFVSFLNLLRSLCCSCLEADRLWEHQKCDQDRKGCCDRCAQWPSQDWTHVGTDGPRSFLQPYCCCQFPVHFCSLCDGGEVLWWLGRCWTPCWRRSGAPALPWSLQSSIAWGEWCRPPASQNLQDFLFNQV